MSHALQIQACIELIKESGEDALIDQLCRAIAISEGVGKNIRPQVRRALRVVAPGLDEMTAFGLGRHAAPSRDLAIDELYARLARLADTDDIRGFQGALAELRRLQTEEAEEMFKSFQRNSPLSMPAYAESTQRAGQLLSKP